MIVLTVTVAGISREVDDGYRGPVVWVKVGEGPNLK